MKLSEQDKLYIRAMYHYRGRGYRPGAGEMSLSQLATMFGVSVPTVRKAIKEGSAEAPENPSATL